MTLYKPIQSNRLYEHVVSEIEDLILTGTMAVDDRLPSETELAEQFGVSRTVVREAMKVLRQKGLVVVYPGKGTFVANTTKQAVRRSLDLMLRAENFGGLASIAQARWMFEPSIAALAAIEHTELHLERLHDTIAEMKLCIEKTPFPVARFVKADLHFHLTLAQATGNMLVELLLNSFVGLQQDQRRQLIVQPGAADRAIHYHEAILAAVEAADESAAYVAMQDHMSQVYERSERLEINHTHKRRKVHDS